MRLHTFCIVDNFILTVYILTLNGATANVRVIYFPTFNPCIFHMSLICTVR